MVSNKFEDYEVLSILGADLNSTCYKVKNKVTSEIFVWKAISFDNLKDSEKHCLLARIEKQKFQNHPHLLKVCDYILQEETKILYLVNEYCSNGNLTSIVHKCLIENEYLDEHFLWRSLYQIACALKIRGNVTPNLSLNNIFLDADYNIKLFCNDIIVNPALQDCQTSRFGPIMFELCTLQPQKYDSKNYVTLTKKFLTDMPNYYSNELKEVVKFTLSTNYDVNSMVDTILCHPTILLKSVQAKKSNIYVKNATSKNCQRDVNLQNASNAEIETAYHSRLDNVKNREIALKVREERLAIKEHVLHKREKKVALMERTVKEKLLQAELYLKRCREAKSTTSGSLKTNGISYDNIDTSFSADCGDSSICMPTSKKLNPEIIKKPANFVRTMSDRRVRFKGHSPLKDMFNRSNCNVMRNSQQQTTNLALIQETSSVTGSDKSMTSVTNSQSGSDKSSLQPKKVKSKKKLDLFSVLPIAGSRKPFAEHNTQSAVIYEGVENNRVKMRSDYRPISWTEESKQHAFDLLRMMNQGDENVPIKHTYL